MPNKIKTKFPFSRSIYYTNYNGKEINYMQFNIGTCPKCGRRTELMLSNNPLAGLPLCFDCIKKQLHYDNLTDADFFCRTYNIPFDPTTWMKIAETAGPETFKLYATWYYETADDPDLPIRRYTTDTSDIRGKVNAEWAKKRSFAEILKKIEPIRESYCDRGHIKWGTQYTFEELLHLDSLYTATLRANNIINPLQKEAVKTLCKLQIEIDNAIAAQDTKAGRDLANTWSTFAKQADLETMISESKTDDITTVAALYDYMEKSGFKFRFYDNIDRDEIDRSIKDIQATNKRLILESTGLNSLLEDMIRKKMDSMEEERTEEATSDVSLEDLMNFNADDYTEVATEDDNEVTSLDFSEDIPKALTINRQED